MVARREAVLRAGAGTARLAGVVLWNTLLCWVTGGLWVGMARP